MSEYSMDTNTVALLHFNDGLKDESGKIWTAVGGAATSTTQSKFGEGSLYLSNGSQYLTTPTCDAFNFGAGDFTIDWWEYRTAIVGTTAVFSSDYTAPGAPTAIIVGYCYDGKPTICCSFTGTTWDLYAKSIGEYKLNTWTHFAVVRNGDNWYAFQDGKLTNSWVKSGTFTGTNIKNPSIGAYDSVAMRGYIDELRISNVARWTTTFDPGVQPNTPAPTNLTASAGDQKIILSWEAVSGATGYNVKRSTTAGGPYTTIASNVTGTTYVDSNVASGTTYYYVVTALGANGESANSNEASATPQASGGQKLLRVTMLDSSERDYLLPTEDVDGFVSWFNRGVGTGTTGYMLQKLVGTESSKEYLAFDKIISFEVKDIQG